MFELGSVLRDSNGKWPDELWHVGWPMFTICFICWSVWWSKFQLNMIVQILVDMLFRTLVEKLFNKLMVEIMVNMLVDSRVNMGLTWRWTQRWLTFWLIGHKESIWWFTSWLTYRWYFGWNNFWDEGNQEALCIWVKIIRMGNMHFLCHFLPLFIVTWSQNESSLSQEKNTQLTSTPRRVMGLYFLLQIGSI